MFIKAHTLRDKSAELDSKQPVIVFNINTQILLLNQFTTLCALKLLNEMGNQNATGVHEEDKGANQSNGHLSNNESTAVEESKDDQLILPTAETQEVSAASASSELPNHDLQGGAGDHHVDDQVLDINEQDGYDEAQGIENEAADPKDDPRDQEIKDTTLNSTGTVLNEPDDLVHSDSGVDVHVLEKINQVPSLHGRRESKATLISIDEVTIKGEEGKIEGLMAQNMLEAEDQLKELIDTVDKTSEQECKASSKNHHEMCFIEEVNKKGSSLKASHNEEFFHAAGLSDALIEHPVTKEEAEGKTGMNCIDEKTGESDQIQVLKALMDTDFQLNTDDPRDQEIKDTTLISNGAVLHEPDTLLHSDARVDDHAFEKFNQDPSLHVRRESKLTSFNIDEISIKDAEGEIEGLVAESMLEEAIDQPKEVIGTVEISSGQECKTSSNSHLEMSFIEEVIEGDISSNASLNQEFIHSVSLSDASIEHPNAKGEAEGTKGMIRNDKKTGESDQIQLQKVVMDINLRVTKHDQEFTSSANLLNCKEVVEDSDDDQTEDFCNVTRESEAEKDPEIADFKDLETVDAKADISCNLMYEETAQSHPPEADSEDVTDKQHNTQSQMEKSPSFNFDLMNLDKIEELDQTPLLNHKNLATMRSLSTPGNARLLIPLDRSPEEKTIKIVQERRRESDDESKSLLHGFLKEKEETHFLKPQENHEKVENDQNLVTQKGSQKGHGMEIVPSLARGKEKRNKAKISSSYFFSICICCTGVAQLNADP